MTANLIATGYITTDENHIAIWATGATPEEAQAATAEVATDGDISGFLTFPATASLIAKVQAEGGATGWAYSGMIACTNAEAEGFQGDDEDAE